METSSATGNRSVSWLLLVGIIINPFIFAWVVLKDGYSTAVRGAAFAWLIAAFALLLIFSAIQQEGQPKKLEATKLVMPASQPAEALPKQSSVPETQQIGPRAALSPEAQELKALYRELEEFRGQAEFQRVGFSPCCRFIGWKRRVEELRRQDDVLLKEFSVTSGDLLQLGLNYALHEGPATASSQAIVARLDFALSPTLPKAAGGGRSTSEGWWCRDIETWLTSLRAMEAGEYARASNMRVPPACPHVLPNVATGPELERRSYKFTTASAEAVFVKVKLKSGPILWAPLEDIEFR